MVIDTFAGNYCNNLATNWHGLEKKKISRRVCWELQKLRHTLGRKIW